MLEKN